MSKPRLTVKVEKAVTIIKVSGVILTVRVGREALLALPKAHDPDPGSGLMVAPRVQKIIDMLRPVMPYASDNARLCSALFRAVENLEARSKASYESRVSSVVSAIYDPSLSEAEVITALEKDLNWLVRHRASPSSIWDEE